MRRINRYVRLGALKRDGHQCFLCHADRDLSVHHRIPRHLSRDDSPGNLVTLCRQCHDTIEALDAVPVVLSWAPYLM
jgi:5-methylcytosine-specific restriction endonuclease McrA